jgi:hypothetical protein
MDQMRSKLLRFSTDDFPEHRRIDAYRDIYSRTIVKHDVEPLGDEPFFFEADLHSLPGLGLASSTFSPCRRWHAAEHIDSDDLLFGVALSGGCVLHQRGRETVIGQGEAVLTSAAHPIQVIIGVPSRHFSLRLPRAIFETRIADPDACNGRLIPSNSEGLALLTGYIDEIRLTELTSPALCDLVVSHVHDLVALLLGGERRRAPAGPKRWRSRRASCRHSPRDRAPQRRSRPERDYDCPFARRHAALRASAA